MRVEHSSIPFLFVFSHSAARQTHHDASNDQDSTTDPAHKKGGTKGVPERAERWDESMSKY